MRNVCRAGRRGAVLAAAGIMAAGLLAACGTTGPGGNNTGLARASGSHPSSRDGALNLARQLLSQLVLPSGAGPARVAAPPGPLRHPAQFVPGPGSADAHQLFTLTQPAAAVHEFLLAHVPAGMRLWIKGQGSGPGGVSEQTVGYAPRSLPAGIYQAQLVTVAVAGPSGATLLRADAEVTWFPARSTAEHLEAARFGQVTVSAAVPNSRPHTVTRVFTSPTVISRLVNLLNGLPAAPRVTFGCPAGTVTFQLAFAVNAHRAPEVTVTSSACLTDQITVSGKAQPALWDRSGKLAAAAGHLLGVKPYL